MNKLKKDSTLQNQEELLLFALEETNDGWWSWNVQENTFYLSPRYWTTFGYDPQEKNHLVQEWQEICHPEDLEKVQKNLDKHFSSKGDAPYIAEVRFKHREGHWITVICRGRTIEWDENGKPLRFVGVHTDITERKKHEDDLKISQEKYEAIIENLPVGFARYELNDKNDFIFTEANHKFDEFLNVDHSGYAGKTMLELFPFLKETEQYEKFIDIAAGGESLHDSQSISEEFGKRKVFDSHTFSATLRDVCFLFNDVTELYESKERYNLAIQGVGVGIWEWFDINGKELFWSDKFLELLGYLPGELKVNIDTFRNSLHPEDVTKTWEALENHFQKKERYDTEFRLKCKDGSYKWFRGTGQATYDENGKPLRMVGSVEDVQQRKDSQESLAEQTKVAQHNAKLASIGQLAAGVGHEINNPLAIIKGYTTSLKSRFEKTGGLDEEYLMSTLEKIDIATERISKITSGLRSFARADDEVMSDFSPFEVLKESYNLVEEIYEKEGIGLDFNLDGEDENIFIYGNRGKFQQVLMNLLGNAKDALREVDSKNIFVTCKKMNDSVQIELRDTGHGVPDGLHDRIFEPFFTTKEVHEGTGIGLSLVHKFIEEMKGEIKVSSGPSKGTTFTIDLPTKIKKREEARSPEAHSSEENYQSNKKLNILIADDEEALRDLLKDMIESFGYKVETAKNGKQALETYLKNPGFFDIVISDMKMPEMDGPTLLKTLRETKDIPQPKFIFSTGGINNNFESKDSELDGLFDAYFLKPFSSKSILKAIKKCVGE